MIESEGWYLVSQKGSHMHFHHPTRPGKLTVPMHAGKELGKGLLHSILKQAGLK
jgi:predicted RNA binding protein YcfA (HicA-like mRNA interferase family)